MDKFLAIIELQGVKEEMDTIKAELERKGIDEPKGFSTLEAYIEDRMNDLENDLEEAE